MAIALRVERVVETLGARGASAKDGVAALATFVELVQTWNGKLDLTAARGDDELVDLMIADAVVLAEHVPQASSVVDVGSGAGAPAIALALLRRDLNMTLVEPLAKRVAFLRTAVGQLFDDPSGSMPEVVRGRGEDEKRAFDVAMSRATLPPPEWLELGAQLAPTGRVAVLLARAEAPSLDGWVIANDVGYRWPLTGAERRLVVYTKP